MNSAKTKSEQAIFDEIETQMTEFQKDYGDLDLDGDDGEASSAEMDELEAALAGTEFGPETAESSGMAEFSILQIADGIRPQGTGDEEGFFGDIWDKTGGKVTDFVTNTVKREARGMIKKVVFLARRFSKYRSCAPKVATAVAAFEAGRYGTALRNAWSAYRCIRAKS